MVKKNEAINDSLDTIISKLTNLSDLTYVDDKVEGSFSFVVKSNEYFIPMEGAINIEEEITKLSEELKYAEGFLKSIQGKLKNERFVNNAPEQVVAIERQKEADALAKIETLKSSLKGLL
jgi:valyl-tRNA synthetase